MPTTPNQSRRTILKPLPADCLLDGQLHPNIAQRLARVRELPMTAVATLHRVERDGAAAHLVWEYVDGRPLAEHLNSVDVGAERQREAARVLDEADRAVRAMHGFGIVHGALHERNVIVMPGGAIKLTHVSPLLYDDADVDLAALRLLRARFTSEDLTHPQRARSRAQQAAHWRPLILFGAAATIACGLAFAIALTRYATARQPQQLDPPVAPAPAPAPAPQ